MDDQEFAVLVEAVKKQPDDAQCWFNLGDAAHTKEDFKTAVAAYLAGLRLQGSDAHFQNFYTVREKYLSKVIAQKEYNMDTFRLPKQTAVIMLAGMLNMSVETLEYSTQTLLTKGFTHILVDFSEVKFISGLGPSTLKKMSSWAAEKNASLMLYGVIDDVVNVLKLKDVNIPRHGSLQEALQSFG